MRTRFAVLAVLAVGIMGASAGAAGADWASAVEVPGTASLNIGGYAQVTSVSCATASVCVAGGWYKDGSGYVKPFVAGETDGVWGHAVEVPGIEALNDGDSEVTSVSCAAEDGCGAGGFYADRPGHYQAFVVDQTDGVWGDAVEVSAKPDLIFRGGVVTSVSCAAPGACVAGGSYTSRPRHNQAFAIVETDGHWGHAIRVRGMILLNRGHDARVNSVSCLVAGDCVLGGHYTNRSGNYEAFVGKLKDSHWRRAVEVPGTAALNRGQDARAGAEVNSVSCAGVGACASGGYYVGESGHLKAFVLTEAHGRWARAITMPGTESLNSGDVSVNSVSCAAGGACAAGGFLTRRNSVAQQAFVVSLNHGHWDRVVEVPGLAALNVAGAAEVTSISCAAPGACVAGGRYQDGSGHYQAFVVSESNGHWGSAVQVPGIAGLNNGDSQVNAISCAAGGPCVAGGTYQDGSGSYQAFVGTGP